MIIRSTILLFLFVIFCSVVLSQPPTPNRVSTVAPPRTVHTKPKFGVGNIDIGGKSIDPKTVESVKNVRGTVTVVTKTGQEYSFSSRELKQALSKYGIRDRLPRPPPRLPVHDDDDDDDNGSVGGLAWWVWAAIFGGAIAG